MVTKSINPIVVVLIILLSLLLQACSEDSPTETPPLALPGIPANVTATAAVGAVTLSWDEVTGATGYGVYWDTDGSVDATDTSVEVAASPFLHSGLTNGTPYHYRVAAVNDAGSSDMSGQVSATPNAALGIRLIACGDDCSFLVNANGYLYAWGENSDGQLGLGSFNNVNEPTLVRGINDVVAVSSGWRHTLVLTGNGRLYAMGYNTYGALGTGDNQPRWSPTLVSGPTNFTAAAAGRHHSLGITADGGAYVWGSNTSGHLGLGYEGGWVDVPTLAMTSFWHTPGIAAVANYASFFKPDDDATHSSPLFSWGTLAGGLLGRDTGGDVDLANTPGSINDTVNFTAISTRYLHVLALHENGSVRSWGSDSDGQLGRFSDGVNGSPAGVALVQHAVAIGAGSFHSLALGDDGRVMSWGGNGFGQLGDATHNPSDVRIWVNNLTNITMIAAGGNHSLALRGDGTLWAWGQGTFGQLGQGNTLSHWEPVRVNGY